MDWDASCRRMPYHRLSDYSYYEDGIGIDAGGYRLCIDESGKALSKNDDPNPRKRYFALAGIMIHEERIEAATARLHGVLRRHMEFDDGMAPELRLSDMLGGKNGFPGMPESEEMILEVFDAVREERMPFFAMVVDKVGYANNPRPYENEDHYAAEAVIRRALIYSERYNSEIDITRDGGHEDIDKMVKETLDDARKSHTVRRRILGIKSYKGYKTGISKKDMGLQLADLCAGAVARAANCSNRDCYGRIEGLQCTIPGRRAAPMIYPPVGRMQRGSRELLRSVFG